MICVAAECPPLLSDLRAKECVPTSILPAPALRTAVLWKAEIDDFDLAYICRLCRVKAKVEAWGLIHAIFSSIHRLFIQICGRGGSGGCWGDGYGGRPTAQAFAVTWTLQFILFAVMVRLVKPRAQSNKRGKVNNDENMFRLDKMNQSR